MIEAPFGTWPSSLTAQVVAGQSIRLEEIVLDGRDLYWSQMHPDEQGRLAIYHYCPQQGPTDVLPKTYSARSRVYEYGGGAFAVEKGIIYFVNDKDQRIYKKLPHQLPMPLTKPGLRFANLKISTYGILAVAESHVSDQKEPMHFLARIDCKTGDVQTLSTGYDFYSQIAISADNQYISWIAWNHPNMPWDDNELWFAQLSKEGLITPQRVDCDYVHQAFFQPQWNKNNQLITVSDKSDWWNLYQVTEKKLIPLFSVASDIGVPLWVFHLSTWVPYKEGVACLFMENNQAKLWSFQNGQLTNIPLPFTDLSQLRTSGDLLYLIAANVDQAPQIIRVDQVGHYQVLQSSGQAKWSKDLISKPKHISFESDNGRQAYGYLYLPQSQTYKGLKDSKPPLLVKSHGGPTGCASTSFNLSIQYWTSRGFAVVDVNYAGSSGYGRAFRKSLENQWGVFDVQDCIAAARYLIDQQAVDPTRIGIMGSSAGGYTALAALTFTDFFHVGASYYGVSNLESLAQETHKFESRYLDRLVGSYPQSLDIYQARSPIRHSDRLNVPIIFFQGADDKVVPPAQSEKMYEALKKKGVKTKYCLFNGEQHGFKQAPNIATALETQYEFFSDVLDFDSAIHELKN